MNKHVGQQNFWNPTKIQNFYDEISEKHVHWTVLLKTIYRVSETQCI